MVDAFDKRIMDEFQGLMEDLQGLRACFSEQEEVVAKDKEEEEQETDSVHVISVASISGSEGNNTIRLWASVHCQ